MDKLPVLFYLAVLFSVLDAATVMTAQGLRVPGPGGAVASVSVTINNHAGFQFDNPGSNSCANTSTTCTFVSRVISATGDTAIVGWQGCVETTCNVNPITLGCTFSASDGVNTWTQITGSGSATAGGHYHNFYAFKAVNATTGTRTTTITISGVGCTFYYASMVWADFVGANTTIPIDILGTSGAEGWSSSNTSTTPSATSAGNVSTAGSVGYAMVDTASAFTVGGVFSLLDNISTNRKTISVSNPTSGATLTASGTMTSGDWYIFAFVVKP